MGFVEYVIASIQNAASSFLWDRTGLAQNIKKKKKTRAALCDSKAAFVNITLAAEIRDSLDDLYTEP